MRKETEEKFERLIKYAIRSYFLLFIFYIPIEFFLIEKYYFITMSLWLLLFVYNFLYCIFKVGKLAEESRK